jgi:sulfonate transport system permease protein
MSTRILPAPSEVGRAAWQLAASGELWTHLRISFVRAGAGFLIGGGLGFLLGLATGLSRTTALALDTTIQMLRNIPPLSLIPLVIVWFGIDETAKVFLVAFGTAFPLYLNTVHGISSIDPALV